MKLFLIFILLIGNYYAQIREGILTYKVELSSENNEMKDALVMFANSNLTIYFDAYRTRSEMRLGNVINMITISNLLTEEVIILKNSIQSKSAIKSSLLDYKMMIDTSNTNEQILDTTKMIINFECHQVIVKDIFGQPDYFWFTKDIYINTIGHNYIQQTNDGIPLEFDLIYNGLKMHLKAIRFNADLTNYNSEELFSTEIPNDYTIVKKEDLIKGE